MTMGDEFDGDFDDPNIISWGAMYQPTVTDINIGLSDYYPGVEYRFMDDLNEEQQAEAELGDAGSAVDEAQYDDGEGWQAIEADNEEEMELLEQHIAQEGYGKGRAVYVTVALDKMSKAIQDIVIDNGSQLIIDAMLEDGSDDDPACLEPRFINIEADSGWALRLSGNRNLGIGGRKNV